MNYYKIKQKYCIATLIPFTLRYKLLDQIGADKKIGASEIEPLNLTEGNISTVMLHAFLFDAKIPFPLQMQEPEVEKELNTGGKRAGAKTKRGSKKKTNRSQKTEKEAVRVIENEDLSADEVSFSEREELKLRSHKIHGKRMCVFAGLVHLFRRIT